MSKIVRGTMLLTIATFLSRFLGMIYVIPFNELVGAQGGALYYYAYNSYNIMLSVAVVGVPTAMSKFVSKYNSLGDYRTSMRMLRTSMFIMGATGLICFLALFFGSDFLAQIIIADGDQHGNTVNDVKNVIQMVSFALLLIPAMSVVRGFFQGNQSMGPTAVSQVIEQVVRIIFVLVSVFLIIKVYDGSIGLAVGLATFATFIGALASCAVLWRYWRKRKASIEKEVHQQTFESDLSTKSMIIELFQYAGPFILVGIATPLYQAVDTFTFNSAMRSIGNSQEMADLALTTINLYGHKLIIIPVTIATGLSLSILPALTKSFTQQNRDLLFQQIRQALQIVLVLVVPAVVGLTVLSHEAYGSIFGMHEISYTGSLLAWYAPIALLFALFTVSSSILQGINEQRFSVVSLFAGFLVKLFFNTVLIQTFGAKGSIIATGLAVGTAVVLNFWRAKVSVNFSFKQTLKRALLIIILSAIMAVSVLCVKFIFAPFLPYGESRFAALVMLIIGVGVGATVYLWFAYKSTLLERTFGDKVQPDEIRKRIKQFVSKFRR